MTSINSQGTNSQRPRFGRRVWRLGRWELGIAALLAMIGAVVIAAQQPPAGGTLTAAQAAAGRAVYAASCASCHADDLGGREAPALKGASFQAKWRAMDPQALVAYIQQNMPLGGPQLAANQAAAVTAFILQSNGTPLAGGGAAPAPQAAAAAAKEPEPRGLTLEGNLQNYTPVTDAMLRNPPPGDWLMARRNYQAWSHSPLAEITTGNVKNLKLEWVWAMHEGGWSEPTPIVHNGIIYIVHTGNVVQALDGKSGDLIWENQVGPDNGQVMRNSALYNDKLYVATTDARLVALDARTGKKVWDVAIADRAKGFGNSSGPIVIHGKVIQGLNACDRYQLDR